jgi:ABC-type sugar transport system substrate-binding protein
MFSSFARARLAVATFIFAISAGAGFGAGPNGTIGAAMPNTKGEWYTPELYGITDEAKKLGYDVIIQDAGGYANVDRQVTQVSNLIAQRVKALLLDAADPAAFNGVGRQAKQAKIPVVAAGSPTVATDIPPDAGATSSHCTIGHELASGAKKLLPNGGAIAILKIVAEQTSEQDVAVALSLTSDFLQRFPGVDLVYGADDTYGVGIARAVQVAHKCGQVKVLFSVLGSAAEEMMRAGCVDYVVAQQPALMGRMEVRLADQLLKGQKPAEPMIQVPLILVTRDNLDKIDRTGMQAPKGWSP